MSNIDETMPCVFCGNRKHEHYGIPGDIQPGDRFRLNSGWASITPGWATVVTVNGDVVEFRLDGNSNLSTMSVKDVPDTGPAFRCRPDFASSVYTGIEENTPCVFCGKSESKHYGNPHKVQCGDRFKLLPTSSGAQAKWASVISVTGETLITFKFDGQVERKFMTVRNFWKETAGTGPAFRCLPDYTSTTYSPEIAPPKCQRCERHVNSVSVVGQYLMCAECAASEKSIAERVKAIDPVNHPSHYTFGKIEVADAIEDWQLNVWRGTALKCIVRAGRKHKETELEDLKKAAWYLAREIARMEKANVRQNNP